MPFPDTGFSGTPLYTSQVSSGSLATPIHSGGFIRGSGGGGSGGDGGRGGGTDIVEDVNAQLVVVLRRLQADMESVLHRLNTLETITLSQHHTVCHHCQVGFYLRRRLCLHGLLIFKCQFFVSSFAPASSKEDVEILKRKVGNRNHTHT